ncbi:hypothetical protein, partial [Burkholderia sp. AU4i]|uniref:hypothetical protein n=1 Tax=Burkholderia sp. AU4i TaxID=1335308 RepID=UPI001C54F606
MTDRSSDKNRNAASAQCPPRREAQKETGKRLPKGAKKLRQINRIQFVFAHHPSRNPLISKTQLRPQPEFLTLNSTAYSPIAKNKVDTLKNSRRPKHADRG